MRHIVNFGLLFSFITLAVTGVMSFVRPFSLPVTRIHIVFGVATLLLVALHLASRIRYFRAQLSLRPTSKMSKGLLAGITLTWAALLVCSLVDGLPVRALINQGHEARNRAEIVRPSTLVASLASPDTLVSTRLAKDSDTVALSVHAALRPDAGKTPVIAIWAETTAGTLIETLYISPSFAYTDQPTWNGTPVARGDVLPIWRNRYTAQAGIEPDGTVDGVSGATQNHQFSLDAHLSIDADAYVLCLEINIPGDTSSTWTDPVLGQPSVLYTGYIDGGIHPKYTVLERTGHGGTGENAGAIQYNMETLGSAKHLLDIALVRSQRISNPQGKRED